MRKTWFTTIVAGAGAIGFAGTSAHANPAAMALRKPAQPAAIAPAGPVATPPHATAELPSSQISPIRNPVKYFAASISEMPIGRKKAGPVTSNAIAPAAPQQGMAVAQSAAIAPPTPQTCIATAQLFERQGDIQQSRQQYIQALTMWPGNIEVLRAAARMEDRQGDLATAEQLYRQAAAANPQHAGTLNDLGLCLARQGKLEPSLQVIEQAIQIQPDKALYRNNAATVLVEMRQDQRAIAHLAAVHGPADANYNFGQLLVQRGRAADATPYFQAAVEQNPGLEPARVALANLQGTTATAQPAAPAAAPAVTPQVSAPVTPAQAQPAGPQFYYPSAQPGGYGATNYQPAPQAPAAPRYQYLPPVASQPMAPRR